LDAWPRRIRFPTAQWVDCEPNTYAYGYLYADSYCNSNCNGYANRVTNTVQ